MKSEHINLLFEDVVNEQTHIDEFNRRLHVLDEKKRRKCIIRPTDSGNKIRRKCKQAKVWGIHYAPVWDRYMKPTTPETTPPASTDTGTDSGAEVGGSDAGVAEIQAPTPKQNKELTNKPFLKPITYTTPDVEHEWEEAERYPSLKNRGISSWQSTVDSGVIIPWSMLDNVQNHEPELSKLNPRKIKNVSAQIKQGEVELPIVGQFSDGQYELIAGNTRIALLTYLGYDPTVLVVQIPDKKRTSPKTKPEKKKPTKKKQKVDTPKKKEKPKSSTERVRRYYKRHPEKVRKYLRDTQDDRVKRNGDRAKAVKKYGEKKMKNHDVHHPNGVNGGKWRLVRKDHGRDKKNENVEYVYLSELMEGLAPNGPWQLISEGGAAGHLAHPYEDNSLTFKNVKDMIKRGLVGGLDAEAPVTEKLDGQNIMFTVKDGRIYFARNKGQVKNKGKNALDVAGIRQMFAGRGNVERAFTTAAEDLQAAVDKLPEEERTNMFADGQRFMNVEIIFPDTKNVIPYDKNVLVFHGTVDYDLEGNEIGRNINDGKKLSDELTKVNAQQQATFGLSGPRNITFNDADTSKNLKRMKEYGSQVFRIQSEFNLKDKDTIEDYKKAWWGREIDNLGVKWTEEERKGLINRWATNDKKFGVKNIEDPEKKKIFREFEATQLTRLQKAAARPLERLFLKVGADTLLRVTNFLSANNPQLTAELKKEVLSTIQTLQQTDDANKLAKLQTEIERLEDIGIDNIIPSEGIVFMYNGNPYKFTGTFAPVNQILGTLKFQKGKAEEITPEEPTPADVDKQVSTQPSEIPSDEQPQSDTQQEQKTIAIFPGRFQPFHAGHYSIYRALVKKFGEDNVYIGSSNKVDPITSPFSFNEKKEIMTKMFGIPEDKIVQVKNPYQPTEILKNYPENTVYVTAVSQKDSERLGGKYYRSYEDTTSEERKGYMENGYVLIAPEMQLQLNGKNISGTQIRELMGNPKITDRAKQEIFTKIYGQFDKKLFDKIIKVTTQSQQAKELTDIHGKVGTKARATMKTPPEFKMPPQQPETEPTVSQQGVVEPERSGTMVQPQVAQQPREKEPEPQTEPRTVYEPGQFWQTTSGVFGAKSKTSQDIRYFRTQASAERYSQS